MNLIEVTVIMNEKVADPDPIKETKTPSQSVSSYGGSFLVRLTQTGTLTV